MTKNKITTDSPYNISIWDYFIGVIFILTSGTMIWFQNLTPKIAFTFYFLVCLINVLKKRKRKIFILNQSLLYCIYIIFIACIGTFFIYSPYVENTTIGYIISIIGSYFLISHTNFYEFRYIITNIIYYITLIGIPIFILTEFNLLPLSTFNFNNITYNMFAGYSIGWPHQFHRYAGLWHEPGACQIFLNIILWLHIEEFINWKWERGELRKITIIVIGLLCTMSTGGILVLMLLIIAIILNLKLNNKYNIIIKPLIILLGIGMLFILYNSSIIQKKIFANESDVEENISKTQRLIENISMFEMSIERPITGWGLGSEEQIKEFIQRDNTGCSNGILYMTCSWGLIWAIPFFILIHNTIKKMKLPISPIWLFIVFILLESNERYLEFPISYIFIFPFKNYQKIISA